MPLELVAETKEQAEARQATKAGRFASPCLAAPVITPEELATARSSPDCIVDHLLFADVGVLIAPGGVGKTTLSMFVSMNIILGGDVFGEAVRKPGPVLLVTAEDTREILIARLRSCMEAASLDDEERREVLGKLRIADVSGQGFKLTEVIGDVVLPALDLESLMRLALDIRPILIIIDPAVSFGVGESRVNDAEQGLIEAARSLRNAVNCAVLYVHHSGKANAREKAIDQYAGRGGSAFADGCRMVLVLQNLTPDEFRAATGEALDDGETGLILARPKMSYCPPPGDIHIRRVGYRFERVDPLATSRAAMTERNANQVWQLLAHELSQGRMHSGRSLERADAGDLTRDGIRDALAWLEASGRVEMRKRPDAGQRGARAYLHPVGSPDE